jgi:hypothetical protein
MTEKTETPQTGSIDYSGKQEAIDKAKQKAHEQDLERLTEEHESE